MLELRRVPLSSIKLWANNPKQHDYHGIMLSIRKYGFRDPPKWDATLDAIVEGNGRITALRMLKAQGYPPPDGIEVYENDWLVPVFFGLDQPSQAAAESYGIDHNNLTLAPLDPSFYNHIWDEDAYYQTLLKLAQANELPITSPDSSYLDQMTDESTGFANNSPSSVGDTDNEYIYDIVIILDTQADQEDAVDRLNQMGLDAYVPMDDT